MARIFTGNYIDLAQQPYGPMCNVFEISDWGGNKVERSGHAAILSSGPRHAKASPHSFKRDEAYPFMIDLTCLTLVGPGNSAPPIVVAVGVVWIVAAISAGVATTVVVVTSSIGVADYLQLTLNLRPIGRDSVVETSAAPDAVKQLGLLQHALGFISAAVKIAPVSKT